MVRALLSGALKVSVILIALMSFGLFLDFLFGGTKASQSIIALIGASLLVLGLAIEVAATHALVRLGGGTPNPAMPPAALVTMGPYAFSRNPLYVGRVLILTASAAILGSVGIAIVTVGLSLGLHWFLIPREERRLSERYGPVYEAYRARVPRWILLRPRPSGKRYRHQ